jgi:hypothetical protein
MYVSVTSANGQQTVLDFATVLFSTYVTHFVNERQADTDIFTYIFAVKKNAQTNSGQRKYISTCGESAQAAWGLYVAYYTNNHHGWCLQHSDCLYCLLLVQL